MSSHDTPGRLTCRETTYLVSDARDRPLTDLEVSQLQAHIAGCAACQVASRQFAQVFAAVDAYLCREPAAGRSAEQPK
ncbi:MAG TPA: zf-HC2 domain-containing protein [Rhodocyclaceae bacterium]|nr:zf-HC2 domain-containing protein [Rhodocyclaceae bacterium]MBP8294984.1 zf-HC2 domain-containing protein [Burkholderiales bacterium]HMV54404.1 zf-HC2 domain-containing protein [Rhodocyclaceae bacterium]HMZ84082.1 zf-HC2 domain-containing protein [Rhodocyclaceae bacterium]HNB79971.1 zf-HC2 domain-containing protein [Rhodocyclaceae bacterium]